MKLENEKVRSEKYYRIGYHSATDKYIQNGFYSLIKRKTTQKHQLLRLQDLELRGILKFKKAMCQQKKHWQ